ncbi:hypothetical protein MACH09_35820 [Vibrio sp. MACH09]|nr:hypothetical protein [Vibrio sp. MACH09]GLO63074.1 hypothetical protein MACH09_35820 [Vibrio sp. MACH09]
MKRRDSNACLFAFFLSLPEIPAEDFKDTYAFLGSVINVTQIKQ